MQRPSFKWEHNNYKTHKKTFKLKPTNLSRLHLVCNDPHDVDSTQSKVDWSQHPLLLHAHVTQEIQDGVKQVVPTFRNVVNAFTNHHLKIHQNSNVDLDQWKVGEGDSEPYLEVGRVGFCLIQLQTIFLKTRLLWRFHEVLVGERSAVRMARMRRKTRVHVTTEDVRNKCTVRRQVLAPVFA